MQEFLHTLLLFNVVMLRMIIRNEFVIRRNGGLDASPTLMINE